MIRHQLAADLAKIDFDLSRLKFPKLVSPKIDGFRCWIKDGVALSRNQTPIINDHIRAELSRPEYNGLDGELCVGPPNAPDVFTRTQSGVKRIGGEPEFTFWVFDDASRPAATYAKRLAQLQERVRKARGPLRVVPQVHAARELVLGIEAHHLADGYEGIMLRNPDALYKYGRSSPTDDDLWKLKRFIDGEAIVTGLEEAMLNENEATRDANGRTKRSSSAAGRTRGKGMVGTIIAQDPEWGELRLQPGVMTHDERREWWVQYAEQDGMKSLIGKRVHFRAFGVGVKEKPRFARFYGLREDD